MFRLLVISLSLCCAVLSGFAAFESDQVGDGIQPKEKISGRESQRITCAEILESRPEESCEIELTQFKPGKYFASRDVDLDGRWEYVCVPLFPMELEKLNCNYRSAIACLDQVENRSQLIQLITADQMQIRFHPSQQDLPGDMHSQLAQKYNGMDFRNCVVLSTTEATPSTLVMGRTSKKLSLSIMGVAIIVVLWNLTVFLVPSRKPVDAIDLQKIVSRAVLPSSDGKENRKFSLLDQLDPKDF